MKSDLFAGKYRIKSTRLKYYDYSQSGMYFVTICTKNRECFFGEIQNNKMVLNEIGQVVTREWQKTEKIRRNIKLYEWVVMPNHFHGIVVILNNNVETHCVETHCVETHCVETHCNVSLRGHGDTMNKFGPQINNLSSIIRGFKSSVKRWCNQNGHEYFSWQSRFHEHIIRSENDIDNIREYIINNPANWCRDRNSLDVFTESPLPLYPPPRQ